MFRSIHRVWVAALVCAPLAGACASIGPKVIVVPQPFPVPRGEPAVVTQPPEGSAVGAGPAAHAEEPPAPVALFPTLVVSTAMELRGVPYRNGGTTPSGFDCSGFTQFVFAQLGLKLPREVRDQFAFGEKIASADIQPGDLLFFSTTSPGPSHVAIAIGEGRFVHAPSSRGVVRVEGLNIDYWATRFIGVRRLSLE